MHAQRFREPGVFRPGIVHNRQDQSSLTIGESSFHRICQASAHFRSDCEPVNHKLCHILTTIRELARLVKPERFTIDPQSGQTLCGKPLPEVGVGFGITLADRSQKLDLCARWPGHDGVCNLIDRTNPDRLIALRAIRLAQTGEEDPEIVVDLCHGAHRGTRASARRFLLNTYRWRKARDLIHLGLRQRGQKLAGIARKTLDITSLPFSIKRINRQRALA